MLSPSFARRSTARTKDGHCILDTFAAAIRTRLDQT
jgi:hypothetical protein